MAAGSGGAALAGFVAALGGFRSRRADLFSGGGANVAWTDLSGNEPAWQDPAAPPLLMCRRRAAPPPSTAARTSTPENTEAANSTSEITEATDATEPAAATAAHVAEAGDVLVVFNGSGGAMVAAVGAAPAGSAWVRVLDSSLPSPADCTPVYLDIGRALHGGDHLSSPQLVPSCPCDLLRCFALGH